MTPGSRRSQADREHHAKEPTRGDLRTVEAWPEEAATCSLTGLSAHISLEDDAVGSLHKCISLKRTQIQVIGKQV